MGPIYKTDGFVTISPTTFPSKKVSKTYIRRPTELPGRLNSHEATALICRTKSMGCERLFCCMASDLLIVHLPRGV